VGSPLQETSKLRTPIKKQATAGSLSSPAAAGDPWTWRASHRLGSNSPHYPEPITQPIADVQKKTGFETALDKAAGEDPKGQLMKCFTSKTISHSLFPIQVKQLVFLLSQDKWDVNKWTNMFTKCGVLVEFSSVVDPGPVSSAPFGRIRFLGYKLTCCK
jgi:hypothetical protein